MKKRLGIVLISCTVALCVSCGEAKPAVVPEGPTKPVPCATFRLDSKGELLSTDTLKYVIAKDQTFALTMEPIGGSKSPTMPIFCVAPVN